MEIHSKNRALLVQDWHRGIKLCCSVLAIQGFNMPLTTGT